MSSTRRPAGAGLAAVLAAAAVSAAPAFAPSLHAQVTTTATLAGRVTAGAAPLPTAQVTAVHRPSGTTYRASARSDGRFTIPGMRVGGPYTVTVRALGYTPVTRENVSLTLGTQADVDVSLTQVAATLTEVTVSAAPAGGTLSAARTGAATNVNREAIQTLPTISRTIGDFTRLTPQASANGSFGGLDSRFNNTTIDGAQFNNAFGLGSGQPGGRTNVSPIPLDAIDQLQVNVAPFDVRQGSFVGASVNAVTRSGTNDFEGSLYYFGRNARRGFVGRSAAGQPFNPGRFEFGQIGARLGGPILRNRLFFFASFEDDGLTQPGTTFRPNNGGEPATGNITRVLRSDAEGLSTFLRDRFNYETGPITGYDFETPSRRALAKLDFNANDANKFSLRYTLLNSSSDFPVSNSNSLGFGNRRGSVNALSFANSGYAILENLRSVVGEWNAQAGARLSNNLLVGYTSNDESRRARGALFPTVDILDGAQTALNFGFEPFTPSNQLRYNTFQVQDNLTAYAGNHELTLGASFERYRSENVFFDGSQSVYTYNSLADFYADANGFLANPNRTASPVALRRFQVRYNNIPGQTEPLQPLEVNTYGAYAQDQWRASPRLNVTLGLRVDVPQFGATAFTNPQANGLTFRDEKGQAVRYETQKLPDTRALFSPRLGFNLNAVGDRVTQVRGGTGIFSGRPAYVWISNQIGQNGILTGFDELNNTTARPFNPNPDAYKPATVTGAPASTYQLNFTDRNFRFPQQWRSNLAVDQRLPGGLVATGEVIYGRDLNGVYYINANLPAAQSRFAGADDRPRYANPVGVTGNPTRLNQNITAAYVLKNQNVGYNYNLSASLEKQFRAGLFLKAAYNYGVARNTIDPGSIAAGSFNGNAIVRDPNNPGVSFSANSPGHRSLIAASYRREYFRLGATTVSFFGEYANGANTVPGGFTGATTSYVYAGDMNGDGANGNDLVYVPNTAAETRFLPIAASGSVRAFSAQEQQDAWFAYVLQDRYLRGRRGQYAERNAVFLPAFFRADLSLAQEVFRPAFGKRNALQLRLDMFNFTNWLGGRFGQSEWGVGRQLVNNQPLSFVDVDPVTGAPRFRMRVVNGQLMNRSFVRTAGINDVYRIQLGARYTFQ
jgi:outer membrane receptor protein involved in Fe transport